MKMAASKPLLLSALLALVVVAAVGGLWLRLGAHGGSSPGAPRTRAAAPAGGPLAGPDGRAAAGAVAPAATMAPASAASAAAPRHNSPVGAWTVPVPYLNPFGAQRGYRSVEHRANGRLDLRYVDRDNMETVRATSGETWELQVDWNGTGTAAFDDLSAYVAALGGQSWPADRDSLAVHVRDSTGQDWWGLAWPSGGGYRLTVCRELRLHAGRALTFHGADFKDRTIHFTTSNAHHRFQSLRITLAAGQATLFGENTYRQGSYRRDLHYQRKLDARKSHDFILDGLPQDASVPLQWRLAWDGGTPPGDVTVSLIEGDDIAPVHDGEALGALRVRGARLGQVWVGEPDGVSVKHPELDRRGQLTPEGDTLFWLPSGYWNIQLVPDALKTHSDTLATRLVPVSAGEMTEVQVGSLIDRAYRDPAVDQAGTDSQLRILDARARGDEATVDFLLQDGAAARLVPTPDNTRIVEGGKRARVLRVDRVRSPPSLVLVLDSSGSMRKSMPHVLASARSFIEGLPDDSRVQLIDFDSQVRLLKGTDKATTLRDLAGIRAGGSTALYDAAMQGLRLLAGHQRPTLVVFTDGVDSREDHSGKGSSATRAQLERAVADAKVPLFTIGFGPGHDGNTLKELAGVSDGTYYSADDEAALQHVFASINDRLGNRFSATYARPRESAPSSQAVITLATDISLSMDMAPGEGGCTYCNYRIDKMKNLFHGFIQRLPPGSLTQLISFSDEVNVSQVFTPHRSDLLQALGSLNVRPGTDILSSVRKAYLSLREVPAQKRVIVYLTDAALDVDKRDETSFEKLLAGIKADGIEVLWVGMGSGNAAAEAPFKRAATLSGGRYVISEDPDLLARALQQALADATARPASGAALTVSVHGAAANSGERRDSDSRVFDFPALPPGTGQVHFDTLQLRTGLKAPQYGDGAAALVYGRDIPRQDVIFTKRMPLDAGGANRAMQWHIDQMYLMRRFHGIDAPSGQVFLALDTRLKNIESEGAAYLIPDFTSHFFISVNGAGAWPASPATWLAETPLAAPGQNDILIGADQIVHGALVFLVPDQPITQAAADFYDTRYGHLTLPLVGPPPAPPAVALTALPKTVPKKLSDTFSMTLAALHDTDHIEDLATGTDSEFKLLELRLDSRMQADLKLAPAQRFQLRIDTAAGPFMVPVNPATARLPLGFLWPVTLAPGSSNPVRLAFQVPSVLKDAPMQLYCDLFGGAVQLPVQSAPVAAAAPLRAPIYHGEGVDLTVNALARASTPHWPFGDYVVADVTLANTRPGTGLAGLREVFRLVPDGTLPADAPAELRPDALTDRLALGMDRDWQVFDGQRRRALLVFAIPRVWGKRGFTLQSNAFAGLKRAPDHDAYAQVGLLADRIDPPLDPRFDHALAVALKDAIARQRAQKASQRTAAMPPPEGPAQDVPVPPPAIAGAIRLHAAKRPDDARALLRSLRWLPSPDHWWQYRNAPEAVLAQGWGSAGDLARLAGGLLARAGYTPALRSVTLTDAGRAALATLGPVDAVAVRKLPAWAYSDAGGQRHLLVVPFMRDLSELGALAFLPAGQSDRTMTPVQAQVRVYFRVRPRQARGLNAIAGSMADALTGAGPASSPDRDVRVLRTDLPLDTLGRDAVDIRVGDRQGRYTAVLENQSLQVPGDADVDPRQFVVTGARIEVALPGRTLVHTMALRPDEDIASVFFTLGVNLPDLPSDAAAVLQRAADVAHASARPTVHAVLAWYTRSIVYRFVAAQSRFESELAQQLQVTAGRTDRERVVLVTVRRSGEPARLRTSVDLMQSANQLHLGQADAVHAFNIASGLFASHLEGAVLPGERADFTEVWSRSPAGTALRLSLPDTRRDDLKYMKSHGFPAALIERAEHSKVAMLIPDRPTRIYGEDRWAWLEIDPQTYQTIALTDTGEHGSFADYVMALEPVAPTSGDYLQFMVGGFIGIDTSVWSVSAFSLQSTDYPAVVHAARIYTAAIGKILDGALTLSDLQKLAKGLLRQKVGPLSFGFTSKSESSLFEWVIGNNASIGFKPPSFLTFKDGFKAGAAYYFKQAKPPSQ